MKLTVLIFCLYVGVNIGRGVVGTKRTPVSGNLNTSGRWEKEQKNFKTGLQTKNSDTSALVDLTIGRSAPTDLSVNAEEVKFLLYTERNPKTATTLTLNNLDSLKNSEYDKTQLTVFVTHGWMSSLGSESCTTVRDAYLKHLNVNVIIVDWGAVAQNLLYPEVAAKVPSVATAISVFMRYMVAEGYLTYDKTILVGHSLGAHVVGIAGYQTGGKAKAIFGLDPALPLFNFAGPGFRISSQDAQHVQIIHTNPGFLGTDEFWGHTSFLMNGAKSYQPSCWDPIGACSHSRAYHYFAESINSAVGFYGAKCGEAQEMFVIEVLTGACFGSKVARMGGLLPDEDLKYGEVYGTPVNSAAPYSMGQDLEGWRLFGIRMGRSMPAPNGKTLPEYLASLDTKSG